MIVLSVDTETTGLDKQNDLIIEYGLVLYSTGHRRVLQSSSFLVQRDGKPISSEITKLTGITEAGCDRFGYTQEDAYGIFTDFVKDADVIATHNGVRFDIPMLVSTAKRLNAPFPVEEKVVIDTMTDLPGVVGEQLITMGAKHGFLLDGAHSALTDAAGVIRLLSYYDIVEVVRRAKSPLIVVLGGQQRHQNNDAKAAKFRWNPDHKVWWKLVKEVDLSEFASKVSFPISQAGKELTPEMLQGD